MCEVYQMCFMVNELDLVQVHFLLSGILGPACLERGETPWHCFTSNGAHLVLSMVVLYDIRAQTQGFMPPKVHS